MKIAKGVAALALVGACQAQADVIGGSIELAYWQGDYSGTAVSLGQNVEIDNQLNFDDSGFLEISASLEHPVPVLPNVRLRHIDMDETANGNIDDIEFNGVTFPADADVKTNLDLSHLDLILYYEILDNYVSVDVGVDVKKFDGQLDIQEIDNPSNRSVTKIDETIPMLYGAAEVELPLTGLAFGGSVSVISFDGDSMQDTRVRLRQNIGLAFLELGYRQFSLDIEDVSSVDVDMDIKGVYLSTGLDF